jgi:hypothetical protein
MNAYLMNLGRRRIEKILKNRIEIGCKTFRELIKKKCESFIVTALHEK